MSILDAIFSRRQVRKPRSYKARPRLGLEVLEDRSMLSFTPTIELSDLMPENGGDGSVGFVLAGTDVGDILGDAVSGAGDINGDGFDDFIIGSRLASPNGLGFAGESYVIFGGNVVSADFDLSSLDGTNGFVINGIAPGDWSGVSVSGAGDVNGDSFDDVIIGASFADPRGVSNAGQSYVVFGGTTFVPSLNLSDLGGDNGFVINGIAVDDFSGMSVSAAGDVNSDGFDDIIIGAELADPDGLNRAGQSYVVFGRESFSASTDLADLDGNDGFFINGGAAFDDSGRSVSGGGDTNGDGFDDVIIGAPAAGSSGEAYVVYGQETFPISVSLADLDGSNGVRLTGADAGSSFGSSVSAAGDVNRDGYDDLIVGAPFADPNGVSNAGKSFVVFGQADTSAAVDVSTLDGTTGFVLNGIGGGDLSGDQSGGFVSRAGDVDADGFDDVIIGARLADVNGRVNAGQSYVVFGRSFFSGSMELSSLDGTNGFAVNGIDAEDRLSMVTGAGDVNGDGVDDLAFGAPFADPGGRVSAGETYVLFGIPAVLSPIELTEQLIVTVEALNLEAGIVNSIDAKLDAARNALNDMNERNDVAAVNSIQAFINAVEAQSGQKIDADIASELIAAAEEILDLLQSDIVSEA